MTQHKWWCLLLLLTVSSSRVWTADQAAQVALAAQTQMQTQTQTPMQIQNQALVSDPTRPPQAVIRAALGPAASAANAPALAESASAASSAPKANLGARVTLVRVGRGKSPSVALIDGRAVTLGERLGDWTVVGIDAQGVTLRGPKSMHRLALLSAKYEVAASSPASAASSSEKESP